MSAVPPSPSLHVRQLPRLRKLSVSIHVLVEGPVPTEEGDLGLDSSHLDSPCAADGGDGGADPDPFRFDWPRW